MRKRVVQKKRASSVPVRSLNQWPVAPHAHDFFGSDLVERGPPPKMARVPGIRTVQQFKKIEQVGKGTYGEVYSAKEKARDQTMVALKKIRMENEKEGFPITAIREIKILKALRHPNIVQLKEIVSSKQNFYMVFEYMSNDLTGLLDSEVSLKFTLAQMKSYVFQILTGLHYMHKQQILHRDIKPSNILLNNKGEVKLADFGLSRPYVGRQHQYTNRVVTLWYRSPELLLGSTQYDGRIDVWAVGCILGELLLNTAILPGSNEPQQLQLIWELCGTPDENDWPDAELLPFWKQVKPGESKPNRLIERLTHFENASRRRFCSAGALELLSQMLALNPNKRLTANQALDSPFFHDEPPRMSRPSELPQYEPCYEWTKKARRQLERKQEQADHKKRKRG